MNLWWFNHHARPPVVPGITRHYSLAKELIKFGIKTTIIHSSFDHLGSMFPEGERFGANLSEPLLRNYEGVDFLAIPTPSYGGNASLGRIRNMYSFYKRGFKTLVSGKYGKPDEIIGSVVHTWGALCGYKLAQEFKVPFIYEVRDLWPLTLVELGKMSRFHPLVLYLDHLDKMLAESARLIITSAPLMKEYYKSKLGLPDEKFLWITNGTDIKAFSSIGKITQEKANSDTTKIYYTGTLGYANALDDLLNVVSKIQQEFPNVVFYLIGNGPQKNKLQQRVLDESLKIVIQDPVPKRRIPELLIKADGLLFNLSPSTIFRFGISPNKLADYHAAGKPIFIIGKYGNNPVKASGAGFAIDSMDLLPEAVRKFMSMNEQQKKAMGQKGIEFAKKNYDWAKLALELNNRLVGLHKTSSKKGELS